jgi:hypothetical protein
MDAAPFLDGFGERRHCAPLKAARAGLHLMAKRPQSSSMQSHHRVRFEHAQNTVKTLERNAAHAFIVRSVRCSAAGNRARAAGCARALSHPKKSHRRLAMRSSFTHGTRQLLKAALLCSAALFTLSAAAQSSPYAKGPDPTKASLEAAKGPFAVGKYTISGASGFGGGTVHYPTASGSYGLIAVAPPYLAQSSSIAWLGPRLASHGFVVVLIDVNSTLDFPESRSTQQLKAIDYALKQGRTSSSKVYNKIDPMRIGVSGHSMGGGATVLTARNKPANIKAAFPLTPWSSDKNFSTLRVPTGYLACEDDTVATNTDHATAFYNSMPSDVPKAYYELKGQTHFCPQSTSNDPMIGKYAVAWFKRFVDEDTRYSQFLSGTLADADKSSGKFSALRTSGL